MIKNIAKWFLGLAFFGLLVFGLYYFSWGTKKELPISNLDPKNASYQIEDQTINLVNGEAQNSGSPASLNYYDVLLGENKATGDLDGDLLPEQVITLNYSGGGSGVFTYLAVLKKGLAVAPTLLVGDRVIVNKIIIDRGVIIVSYLDRGETEPMAASPTVAKILKVKLVNNQLKQING